MKGGRWKDDKDGGDGKCDDMVMLEGVLVGALKAILQGVFGRRRPIIDNMQACM